MAGGDCRLFNLLSYAVCGGKEDTSDGDYKKTLSNIHSTCLELIQRDNNCDILKNVNGQLCGTYPENLIIPLSEGHSQNMSKLLDLVYKGRLARTRARFAVPALLVNGKYVCRSSTLAGSPEIYYRKTYGYWVQGELEASGDPETSVLDSDGGSKYSEPNGKLTMQQAITRNSVKTDDEEEGDDKEWLPGKMRNADINLLQFLKVDTIFDLMVENKKVKYGMNVTSSEKVDKEQRYLKFNLLSVPYPGCEFFAEYRKRDYCAEGLKFDWKQNFVDADLHLPKHNYHLCDVKWENYVEWDLVELTQNYLKLHLRSLMDGESNGILLHCISGWDRTPLFISLMRLSLWADGLVHQSLNVEEIVYFTVAYDWLLFSHKFSDRISSGEEIFYFCFDFLKYIYSEEYSMLSYAPLKTADKRNSNGSIENSSDEAFDGNNSCNHTSNHVSLPQGVTDNIAENSQLNTEHQNDACEVKTSPNRFVYSNWENSLSSPNVSDDFIGNHREVSELVADLEALNIEGPAKLEVGPCDAVQPVPSKCSTHTDHEPYVEGYIKRTETNNVHSQEPSELLENQHPVSGCREKKLQCARELLIENYQTAIKCRLDGQQASNSGFAATLFNQISSFVRR